MDANSSSSDNDFYDSETDNNYDMTDSFNSDVSDELSLSYVDRAVHDIMVSDNTSNIMENNADKHIIMKFMISCLHEQIISLKKEVEHLRTDAKCKNSTISSLFSELASLQSDQNNPVPMSNSSFKSLNNVGDDQTPKVECTVLSDSHVECKTVANDNNRPFKTIKDQLTSVRNQHKSEYYQGDSSKHLPPDYELPSENLCNITPAPQITEFSNTFPPGTTILIGDSMISNLTSKGLSGNDRNVHVLSKGGARIKDVQFELMKIIPRKPSHIILHVSTNNATTDTSRQICDDLMFLKFLIHEKLPECEVTISCPILRHDNGKANMTIQHLNRHLKNLDITLIDNSNIKSNHISRKGLHLNERGVKQLASNIITHLKRV